ncbi:BrnT family toxin [Rhizobium sp. SG_E_25_P2]|uniref:BrnT family toxin n=1 Tax=Rhizobium sp. SG_E_25_P2 TaxID=2879942 RepID=UPI002474E6D5|nr:BrnT family toxin [Rhizobium sp. SG_E_25_P2]
MSYELAAQAWKDPHLWTFQGEVIDGEAREHSIGMIGAATLLLVVHTDRDRNGQEIIRIISARRATARETYVYRHGRDVR